MRKINMRMGVSSIAFFMAAIVGGSASAQSSANADQAADQDNSAIGDIVVTATRKSEALQKIPVSITALGNQRLSDTGVSNLETLGKFAPNLQVFKQFVPGNALFQIRGQVQTDTSPTIDPSVGVYYDDIYIARSAGSLLNFVDVDRVEVLKGVQGTLFGKNTTGGAIRILSRRPTDVLQGYVSGSYESFDKFTLEGMINVPLGERAAFRAVGQYVDKSGGYATNTVTGKSIDTERSYFGRAALKVDPTESLSILVQGDYSRNQAGGLPSYIMAFIPAGGASTALSTGAEAGFITQGQLAAITAGNGIIAGLVRTPRQARLVGADLRSATASSFAFNPVTGAFTYNGGETDARTKGTTWGLLGNITLDLGSATIQSITGYRDTNYFVNYNLDGTRFNLIDSRQTADQHQFSQELILNGSALGNRLDYTFGGIYFNETAVQGDRTVPLAAAAALRGGAGTLLTTTGKNESFGVFGQGTFRFTERLSLTAGLRYTHDKRGFLTRPFNVALGTGAQTCILTAANGGTALPQFSAPCQLQDSASFNKVNYTVGLNYQAGPTQLIYAKTSRGFRAGGFNSRVSAVEVFGSFRPEIVTDYEAGIKADWLGGTLRTNLAVYHSRATDVQQSTFGVIAGSNPPQQFTKTTNIGTRKVTGFELELVMKPSQFLTFDASVGHAHARLANPNAPDVTYVAATPAWTLAVGGTAEVPLGESLGARLRVDLSHRSKMYDGDPIRAPAPPSTLGAILSVGRYSEVTLLNARLTLVEKSTGIELAVYGRNLTNTYYNARQVSLNGLGLRIGNLAEPRVIGMQLKVPFGAK